MTTQRRRRALIAVAAAVSLLLAACGTRLDHQTIAQSAAGDGTHAGVAGEAGTPGEFDDELVGEDGEPLDPDEVEGNGVDGDSSAAEEPNAGSGRGGGQDGDGTGDGARDGSGNRGDGGARVSGDPIVIGSVGTYSGPIGVAYRDTPRALQAWAAATNGKGGINGRPVKVIVADDGGDSAKAMSQVQELVQQHKAVAMVASYTTAQNMKAWVRYVEQQKFPVIGECNAVAHSSPMVFSPCPTLKDAAYGTALIGAEHGKGKKFGALFCTESDDCSFVDDRWFAKGDAQKAGLDPVYRARISITQPDFTSECIQARNAGVELFAVIGDANTVGRVAASCRRQNFNPQYLQPDVTVNADTVAKPGLGDVLAPSRVFPFAGLSTSGFTEFAAAWKKYGGGSQPGGSAATGWSAAKIFEKAAKGAGQNISRDALVKQLHGFSNDRMGGLTVPLTYAAGKNPQPGKCMFIMQGKDGKWTAPQSDKPTCF